MLLAEMEHFAAKAGILSEIHSLKDELEKDGISEIPVHKLLDVELRLIKVLDQSAIQIQLERSITSYNSLFGPQAARIWETALRAAGTDIEQKRVLLVAIKRDLYHYYESYRAIAEIKSQLFVLVGAFAIGLALLLGLVTAITKLVVTMILLLGLAGAFLSIYIRIAKLQPGASTMADLMSLLHGTVGLFVSLLLGTIFPLIAVLFIASGNLHGSFLPRVDNVKDIFQPYSDYYTAYTEQAHREVTAHEQEFHENGGAQGNQQTEDKKIVQEQSILADDLDHLSSVNFGRNFAKLLLLAFVCGFSERIIPDAVDNFAKKLTKRRTVETE
jgi:hypothetical protein